MKLKYINYNKAFDVIDNGVFPAGVSNVNIKLLGLIIVHSNIRPNNRWLEGVGGLVGALLEILTVIHFYDVLNHLIYKRQQIPIKKG